MLESRQGFVYFYLKKITHSTIQMKIKEAEYYTPGNKL